MEGMHGLLERQLRRLVGEGASIPEEWMPLLVAVIYYLMMLVMYCLMF